MNDKLKEIRDRIGWKISDPKMPIYLGSCIESIQSETYQLGRQEVIDEIEGECIKISKLFNSYSDMYNYGYKQCCDNILFKLNNLKK